MRTRKKEKEYRCHVHLYLDAIYSDILKGLRKKISQEQNMKVVSVTRTIEYLIEKQCPDNPKLKALLAKRKEIESLYEESGE